MNTDSFTYACAISYAEPDNEYAAAIFRYLDKHNIAVFYDKNEPTRFIGKPLSEELLKIYSEQAEKIVILLSADYVDEGRKYPKHEARAAIYASLSKKNSLIIVRLDDSHLPGLNPDIGYICAKKINSGAKYKPLEIAKLVCEVVKKKSILKLQP